MARSAWEASRSAANLFSAHSAVLLHGAHSLRLQPMRFSQALPGSVLAPRLDAIGPDERLDPDAPVVAAYLGGRPVILARPDPRVSRGPGVPSDLTVPVTVSRFRRALDIEAGRGTMRYEPSLIDDWPVTHLPFGETTGCSSCQVRNVLIAAAAAALTFWIMVRK